jgi:hypothetical protein
MFNALPTAGELIVEAERRHAQYPQYVGRWNGWVLGIIKRDVKTKTGLAFKKDDVVLVKPEVRDLTGVTFDTRKDKRSLTAYSFRNNIDTGVWASYVDVDVTSFPVVRGM